MSRPGSLAAKSREPLVCLGEEKEEGIKGGEGYSEKGDARSFRSAVISSVEAVPKQTAEAEHGHLLVF